MSAPAMRQGIFTVAPVGLGSLKGFFDSTALRMAR